MITAFPYLVSLCLFHLKNCNDLPPLGKLRNLRYLHIKGMPKLRNLDMGLSGGPQPLKKLTHLKLESLMNLKELSIFCSIDTVDQDFMFPLLEELSVLFCPRLIFKPSLPRCKRYEIRECNNILSCGEPLGPSSSPLPTKIEISGCLISSSWLEWLKSMNSLKKVVIVECIEDDGATLISSESQKIEGTQEQPSTNIPHETKNESSSGTKITQDGVHKVSESDSSITQKLLSRSDTTSAYSAEHISSFEVSTEEPDWTVIFDRVRWCGVGSLSLRQVKKATRKFSRSYKLFEDGTWTFYKAVLPDSNIVIIRRAKKGRAQYAQDLVKDNRSKINHWSLVRFLGVIDEGNEFIMITEYVPNGTLRQYLNDQHVRILDFNQRVIIAIDVAIALTYLHFAAGETMICYNLTTESILITDSYRAKVCSCDLSGCGSLVPMRGTLGYIDPEYLGTTELTAKSDVYSFGIVLLEIISSQKPIDHNRRIGYSPVYHIEEWVRKKLNEGQVNEILDDRCLTDGVDDKVVKDWLSLALRCAASRSDDRPSIEEVGERLWEIWKDHRRHIGKPHDYERSWAEFLKQEGIVLPESHESKCAGSLDVKVHTDSIAMEHQELPGSKLGSTKEEYEAHTDIEDIYNLSRCGSLDSITLSPR